MIFYLITNNLSIAKYAIGAGVDRIFLDLEINGKVDRQFGRNTVISGHTLQDVERMREVVPIGQLMVRVNPIHQFSKDEINSILSFKPDVLMLPMFKSVSEVETFIQIIDGRAQVSLLFETVSAIQKIDEILTLGGVSEAHIGLNDLHIELGLNFMLELFAAELLDHAAYTFKKHNIPFGIGGVARIGFGDLPAEDVLVEHIRLGSSAAILSRAFHGQSNNLSDLIESFDLKHELNRLRQYYLQLAAADKNVIQDLHHQNLRKIKKICFNKSLVK